MERTLREATTSAKQTWRSRESGSASLLLSGRSSDARSRVCPSCSVCSPSARRPPHALASMQYRRYD